MANNMQCKREAVTHRIWREWSSLRCGPREENAKPNEKQRATIGERSSSIGFACGCAKDKVGLQIAAGRARERRTKLRRREENTREHEVRS